MRRIPPHPSKVSEYYMDAHGYRKSMAKLWENKKTEKKKHNNIGRWELSETWYEMRAEGPDPIKYQLTTHTSPDPTQRLTQQIDYNR